VETIQHLFIEHPFAKIIWNIVHLSFNITHPTSIANLFGNWLNGVIKAEKPTSELVSVLFFGLYEMILSLTNQLFHPSYRLSLLGTQWIRMWSYLQLAE
jgi:hypothetical protein